MANLGRVVYLTETDKQTLFETGTVTAKGETVNYSDNDLYITPQLIKGLELINSAEVSSDNIISIDFTLDKDGNTFELSKAVVVFKGWYSNTSTASRNGVLINNNTVKFYTFNDISPTTSNLNANIYELEKIANSYKFTGHSASTISGGITPKANGVFGGTVDYAENIKSLSVNGNQNNKYAIGTTVELWGIRV